eukprot:1137402-Pelagomonas_calceolata.AAC.3
MILGYQYRALVKQKKLEFQKVPNQTRREEKGREGQIREDSQGGKKEHTTGTSTAPAPGPEIAYLIIL